MGTAASQLGIMKEGLKGIGGPKISHKPADKKKSKSNFAKALFGKKVKKK